MPDPARTAVELSPSAAGGLEAAGDWHLEEAGADPYVVFDVRREHRVEVLGVLHERRDLPEGLAVHQ